MMNDSQHDSQHDGPASRNVDLVEAAVRAEAAREDRPPSLRFRILFTAAMIIIALGYTWVWRAKTDRVVAEPAPALALDSAVSQVDPGGYTHDELGGALVAQLRAIPGFTIVDARRGRPVEPEPAQALAAQLSRGPAGYVLEVRRRDVQSGDMINRYRVEGATLDETVYRMGVQIAMSFGLPRPQPTRDTISLRR
jgi:hypothetical protein